ncbi:helix-turn-helix domain-containing protein [Metapseudomonas otitidis]|uniref:helix-turn-helix domain-containing protein n=1 Tax=Metapseudomonas otitidis TaxID=319939 RepID=UPI0024488DF4|nr:helix-turn-helix domain-containing protein [Pseudomonas otitidis]MDG9784360.1 helix-turn-helix domain-containing protein [Pseudomonas otitidis]
MLSARLKAVRAKEGVTQAAFCNEVGLSLSTYKKYESNEPQEVSLLALQKIVTHARYSKYALWLLTGNVVTASEQTSPL